MQARLLSLIFLTSIFACRSFTSFFSKGSQQLAPHSIDEANRNCIEQVRGWVWVDQDCRHIQTHFIATTIAYFRVFGALNTELTPYRHVYKQDFFDIYELASKSLIGSIERSKNAPFLAWLRAAMETWKGQVSVDPEIAYKLAYSKAYDYLIKNEDLAIPSLSSQFGKDFFSIIQTERTNPFPMHDSKLRSRLKDAEIKYATVFGMWNKVYNSEDPSFKDNEYKLEDLFRKIITGIN